MNWVFQAECDGQLEDMLGAGRSDKRMEGAQVSPGGKGLCLLGWWLVVWFVMQPDYIRIMKN